jgi:5-methylcytosine-specific restriction endonuclease McrA
MPLSSRKKISTKGVCTRSDLKPYIPAFRQVFRDYLLGAWRQEREFSLTPAEVWQITQSNCHYCGTPPSTTSKYRTAQNVTYNGLDRVDNEGGYVTGNVVACCRHCNSMKSSLPVEVFLDHVRRVAAHQAR